MKEETAAPSPVTPPANPRSGSCLIRGLIGLGVVALVVGLLIWWYNRPIRPVELTPPEIKVVEQKIATIQPPHEAPPRETDVPSAPPDYQPGKREIILTDREINGLLHRNTKLGDQIAFEFAPGAIHARLETLLPEDVPVMGGKKLRARAKFTVNSLGPAPTIVLDDLTVWGVSVPNDWLGGIKGKNLLGELLGSPDGTAIPGVDSITIQSGRLVICLKE